MPIYQYQCLECSDEFEYFIVRSDDKPSCPSCASENLEKQVTLFSVGKSSSNKSAKPVSDVKAEAKSNSSCGHDHGHSPKKKSGRCSHGKGQSHGPSCSSSYVNSLLKKYG